MLHINNINDEKDSGEDGFDPWVKMRAVLDKVNHTRFYVPSRNVSIDESMIGMKNRCVYIQYMPNKRHARFGIKKFEVCDSNGYVLHVRLYVGKDFNVHHDEGQAFGVVKELMSASQLRNKGYHLHTDNFYTKPALAEYLLEQKTLLTVQ
ncbi:PiggyBac transposable element-derived protein 4 [Elysia marginata]|uniref:PiggyBac transposable element-derived protein 4 n=1 Tax=Elysia marginata TaxID=1093978 RepID=A0AAV4IYU5_9GAST|nr:PiggyBac transposable element-derived protein 4 [Elysia marginata]